MKYCTIKHCQAYQVLCSTAERRQLADHHEEPDFCSLLKTKTFKSSLAAKLKSLRQLKLRKIFLRRISRQVSDLVHFNLADVQRNVLKRNELRKQTVFEAWTCFFSVAPLAGREFKESTCARPSEACQLSSSIASRTGYYIQLDCLRAHGVQRIEQLHAQTEAHSWIFL